MIAALLCKIHHVAYRGSYDRFSNQELCKDLTQEKIRQTFMIHNLDAGIRAFSFQNVCLSIIIGLWFGLMFRLNCSHMPDVPKA